MIRRGTPEDLERLRQIQAATLAEPWPELLTTAAEGPPLLLVLEPDAVVGYAIVVAQDQTAYVAEFAIAPDRQGDGHGSRLMEGVLARLRAEGYEEGRLTVQERDERARAFYERHGFAVRETLVDHYDDGDGLLLARSLGE
jgi:ribosomal-protein-alanine N-acetyltransferase